MHRSAALRILLSCSCPPYHSRAFHLPRLKPAPIKHFASRPLPPPSPLPRPVSCLWELVTGPCVSGAEAARGPVATGLSHEPSVLEVHPRRAGDRVHPAGARPVAGPRWDPTHPLMDTGGSTFGVSESRCSEHACTAHSCAWPPAPSTPEPGPKLPEPKGTLGRFSHIACGRVGELLPAFLIMSNLMGKFVQSFICISDHLL